VSRFSMSRFFVVAAAFLLFIFLSVTRGLLIFGLAVLILKCRVLISRPFYTGWLFPVTRVRHPST
jgi:hypothetical protein